MTVDQPSCTLSICDRCGADTRATPGAVLLQRLSDPALDHRIRLLPVRCMAGCARPLVVGFSAPHKASYLFGDIDPARDAAALLAFAALYASLPDGWCNEGARPEGLRGKTLARIPSAQGWPS